MPQVQDRSPDLLSCRPTRYYDLRPPPTTTHHHQRVFKSFYDTPGNNSRLYVNLSYLNVYLNPRMCNREQKKRYRHIRTTYILYSIITIIYCIGACHSSISLHKHRRIYNISFAEHIIHLCGIHTKALNTIGKTYTLQEKSKLNLTCILISVFFDLRFLKPYYYCTCYI